MRTPRVLLTLLTLAAASLGIAHAGGSNPEASNGSAFVHVVRDDGGVNDNTSAHYSFLVSEYPRANISPLTDDTNDALVFVTNNVTFSTANQAYPYGVAYGSSRWNVFNTTGHHFGGIGGQAFNVQVANHGQNIFVHSANAGTITSNYTILDHPLVNGNPNALLSVTMRPGFNGTTNGHHIGVFYNIISGRWAIFNQDMAAMPDGATFNVQVLQDGAVDFLHIATVGNIVSSSKTLLDHPLLNENLNAKIIVTQNWGAINGVYNNHTIGVEYDNATQKWQIVNTDGAGMPANAKFNVHIAGTNSSGDGALLNGGFEVGVYASSTEAARWNTAAAGKGSKRVCNAYAPVADSTKILANTGECAFLLKGASGQARKISQNVPVAPGNDGGTASALLWAKASNVTGLKAKITVTMDDGAKVSFKLPGAELNGTYAWKPIGNSLLLPPVAEATKIAFKITINGTGKVYLDDVSASIQIF